MNNVNLMPDLVSVTEPIYRWQITLSLYMCQIHKNKSHNSWNNSNYACGDAHACAPHLKRLYTIDLATTLNKLLIILPLTSNVSYADETCTPTLFCRKILPTPLSSPAQPGPAVFDPSRYFYFLCKYGYNMLATPTFDPMLYSPHPTWFLIALYAPGICILVYFLVFCINT